MPYLPMLFSFCSRIHRMRLLGFALAAVVAVAPTSSMAESAVTADTSAGAASDALIARLNAFNHLRGAFVQRELDDTGELQEASSGAFALLRPGYFSWDITSPDSQLIVADPQYLWHFDRDLETVTRRAVTGGGQMAPLQVLGGDEMALRNGFEVTQTDTSRFVLQPRDRANGTEAGFESLTVTFEEGRISRLQIVDALEHTIDISLTDVRSDPALTPEAFTFAVPPGADVFYHDE